MNPQPGDNSPDIDADTERARATITDLAAKFTEPQGRYSLNEISDLCGVPAESLGQDSAERTA